MTPGNDPLVPLRVTALLVAWCGMFALVAAGLMTSTTAVAAAAVTTVVAASCSLFRSENARRTRKQIGFVVLTAALAFVAFRVDAARDVTNIAGALPPLLIGLLTAQGLGADKRHDVMVSVTVGEFMIVLAAGVSPTPILAVPLIVGWALGIVALIQSHHLHVTDCAAPRLRTAVAQRARVLQPALAAAPLAIAIGLVLFLLLPQPDSGAAQRRLRGAVTGDVGGTGKTRASQRFSQGPLDMRTRGDLGNEPVAEVPGDSPQLWRGRIYERFDGTRWTADDPQPLLIRNRVSELPPDPLDEGVQPAGPRRTDPVRTLSGFDGSVIAPGTPVAVTTRGRMGMFGGARIFVQSSEGYVVTSALPETDVATLDAASGPDPGRRWLQLPRTLPARVHTLAEQIAGAESSRPAAVAAISRYLAERKRYDLNSPVPPPGQDAVDHFLFDSDSGFCEHFAAAEVILLRSLGIPARMATGYGYGKDTGDGARLFTSANAHAWVEVWYPGIGWSPNDPTPPSFQEQSASGDSVFTRLVRWFQRVLSSTRGRLLFALFIVAAGAALYGAMVLRRRRRRAPTAPTAATLAGSLLTAFARLERALEADGRPRAAGETLAELQRRLGADAAGRHALATLEHAIYSPRTVNPDDVRAAVHAFEQLAGSIFAANAARGQLADSIGVRR